jgi:hypothetical protein
MLTGVSQIAAVVNKILTLVERLLRTHRRRRRQHEIDQAHDDVVGAFRDHFNDGMCHDDNAADADEADPEN